MEAFAGVVAGHGRAIGVERAVRMEALCVLVHDGPSFSSRGASGPLRAPKVHPMERYQSPDCTPQLSSGRHAVALPARALAEALQVANDDAAAVVCD